MNKLSKFVITPIAFASVVTIVSCVKTKEANKKEENYNQNRNIKKGEKPKIDNVKNWFWNPFNFNDKTDKKPPVIESAPQKNDPVVDSYHNDSSYEEENNDSPKVNNTKSRNKVGGLLIRS